MSDKADDDNGWGCFALVAFVVLVFILRGIDMNTARIAAALERAQDAPPPPSGDAR